MLPSETHFKSSLMRQAEVTRQTAEPKIRVRLNLDGKTESQPATGIVLLDHMPAQCPPHGAHGRAIG